MICTKCQCEKCMNSSSANGCAGVILTVFFVFLLILSAKYHAARLDRIESRLGLEPMKGSMIPWHDYEKDINAAKIEEVNRAKESR